MDQTEENTLKVGAGRAGGAAREALLPSHDITRALIGRIPADGEALPGVLGLTSVIQNRDTACLLPASFIASLLAKLRTFIKTVQYFI